MLKFPQRGMRVKCIDHESDKYGCVGTVKQYNMVTGVAVEFDYDGAFRILRREGLRQVRKLGRGA